MAINKAECQIVKNDQLIDLTALLVNPQEQVYHFSFQDYQDFEGDVLKVTLSVPILGFSYFWHPTKAGDLSLTPIWSEEIPFKANYSIPILSFLDQKGDNRLSMGFSAIVDPLAVRVGVHEESKCLHICLKISRKRLPVDDLQIYLNSHQQTFYAVIYKVRDWIYAVNKIKCCAVPEAAWQPVYSTWYSFHQGVNEAGLQSERQLFSKYALATLILDDGWQTEDQQRKYAFAGDWELAEQKFPNFLDFVNQLHAEQQKILLWLSLPYLGKASKGWERFKDKLLYVDDFQAAGILDVRFSEVRGYLIEKVDTLFAKFAIDGVKLDFIDVFIDKKRQPFNEEWDVPDLEQAILTLLQTLMQHLKRKQPALLVEFREDYFGPKMNELANIFRVKDCPNDALNNRLGIVRLRLLCPEAAVHSDMLMWHEDESGEYAALQVLNCLYGVPQISVELKKLRRSHQKMLAFWLGYMNENADVLYNGEFCPENPQQNFNLIVAKNARKKIVTMYDSQPIIVIKDGDLTVDIVNGTGDEKVIVYFPQVLQKEIWIKNCYGEIVEKAESNLLEGYVDFFVPKSGLLTLKG